MLTSDVAPEMTEATRYAERLAGRIAASGSHLCVGLDPRPERHDGEIGKVEGFLRRVVEETSSSAAAFKPNSAYFEAMGAEGMALLQRVIETVPREIPVIFDGKRSDIGETQRRYAEAAFGVLGATAATLNPFMGYDSIEPFLEFPGRGVYLLALTSNPGSEEIEKLEAGGRGIYERVGEYAARAAREERATDVGLVTGLTTLDDDLLERLPDVPLLVPGLGAQGGDLGLLEGGGRRAPIVVNVSRGVLYGEKPRSLRERAEAFAASISAALD